MAIVGQLFQAFYLKLQTHSIHIQTLETSSAIHIKQKCPIFPGAGTWDTFLNNSNMRFVKNRYHFAPKCPCGKNNRDGKFAPFDIPENQRNGWIYGYCHSCGESFLPNTKSSGIMKAHKHIELKKQIKQKFVSQQLVNKTYRHYDKNIFAIWLKVMFNGYNINFSKFGVGTAKGGYTIFWYINYKGEITNGKKLLYKPNGHRNKDYTPCYLYKKTDGYYTCLFGEHLLSTNISKTICLVESEKSAIIGNTIFPDFIWLASGGANALNYSNAQILRRRKVIYPHDADNAGRKSVEQFKQIAKSIGFYISPIDLAPNKTDGSDIVDLIINEFK